jgi:hypothetical protein
VCRDGFSGRGRHEQDKGPDTGGRDSCGATAPSPPPPGRTASDLLAQCPWSALTAAIPLSGAIED